MFRLEQDRRHLRVAVGDRERERRVAAGIDGQVPRSGLHQPAHALRVALGGGGEHRRVLRAVPRVDVRPLLD